LEPEAATPDGADQHRPAGVVAELAAYPAEVHVDGLRRRPEARAPDVAHQLVAAHDVARTGGQGVEQVVLLAGQHDLPVGAPHPAGRGVDANGLDLEHGQTVGRMAARRSKTGKLAPLARSGEPVQRRAQWRRTATGSTSPNPRTGRAGGAGPRAPAAPAGVASRTGRTAAGRPWPGRR